ncbi:MAG: hypothetical protein V3T22_04430 [Planctomycetota bacterium]
MKNNQGPQAASPQAYAHTKEGAAPEHWHRLDAHLGKTAGLAGTLRNASGVPNGAAVWRV